MSSTHTVNEHGTPVPTAAPVDLKLEVVPLPVADVDRAKRFYEGLGWRLDADFASGDDWRVVQLTPPGSPCSVSFGKGYTTAVPGSAQGTFLVVDDIEAARARTRRTWRGRERRVPLRRQPSSRHRDERTLARPRPERQFLFLIRVVQRSRRQQLAASRGEDAVSRTRTQLGRRDGDRAAARSRGAPRRVRAGGSEAPLVGVVRRIHRGASARQDS